MLTSRGRARRSGRLTREDVLEYRQFDDAIALGAYGTDVHYPGKGAEMTWLEPGRPGQGVHPETCRRTRSAAPS